MNSMDERWNNCTRAARTAPEETPPPVPLGFAVRAMRAARDSGESSTLDLWSMLSRRALAFASAAIMLAGSLLWWEQSQDTLSSPSLADDAMQQVLWQP